MFPVSWSGLINNVVQIGLTVSAAALVLFLLRRVMKKRYPARAICFVWVLLAIRLLIPVQLTLPDAPVQVTPIRAVTVDMSPREEMQSTAQAAAADETRTPRVSVYRGDEMWHEVPVGWNFPVAKMMFILWGAGILAFLGWQAYSYIGFVYLARETGQAAERDTLRRVFEEQKQSLGIRRDIPLVVTPAADCPMLAGFLRPALYLPDEALSEQEALFVFRHELTHLKRGDLWLKLLLTAARAVHWFNPLVYLMARFAQEDIELACDDAVVRGMDGAQRRAYGETILKSATAQVKKRALVSCFTGDKKTLMRRFEGLFDTRAKKRGVALVVAAAVLVGSLGCAVSVGESKDSLTEELRIQLAEQWAQSGNPKYGYTVKLDGDNTYALFDHTNTVMWDDAVIESVPHRLCWQLSFEKGEDGWQVSGSELIAESGVASLDEFRILYENDLGFPDFLGRIAQSDWDPSMMDISTPDKAAVNLLYLRGNISVREGIQEDICDVSVTFADGSEVTITMVNQFDQGWLPQDFTYENGQNDRTAADLAGQYARGVVHKSGQFIYPILTAQKQQEFRTAQQIPGGGFSWKYGGSSPSYRGYTLVPVDDEGSYLAVFQMYGGGVEDERRAVLVSTAQADGRRVIDRVTEVAESNYTKSDLFKLYYDSGLPWPTIPEGAENFNGASLDTLTRVRDAAETVFGYFGENVEHIEGNQHLYTLESWFTSEVVSESETEAVVRLTFVDNSPSVDVRMRKTGGYWLPVGLAGQFDDGFGAYLVEDDSLVSYAELPVGATVAQAIENANGEIPLVQAGQVIKLEPAWGKILPVDGTLSDAVVRADGTLQYTEKETQKSSIRFEVLQERRSAVYLYTAEHIPAEYLNSASPDYIYRGVTVTYRSAHITGIEQEYTAAFVYRLETGSAASQPDYTITSTTYHNDTYGYTLTLPECFVDRGYLQEMEENVRFGMKDAWPGEVSDPYGAGAVMSLSIRAADSLEAEYGADWEQNFPIPCKKLAEQDGLTYYLEFASDVQYDPQNAEISAAYQEMRQAAEAMDGSSITIDTPTEAQRQARMEQWLYDMADTEGYTRYTIGAANDAIFYWDCTVEVDGNTAAAVFDLRTGAGQHCRAVEMLEASDEGGYHLTRQDWIMDENTPTDSLERFRLRYDNGLGLPEWEESEVRTLLEAGPAELRDPVQAAEWSLGLSGGTAGDRIVHPIQQVESWVHTWADGSQVRIGMKAVQMGGAAQPIYLPIWWDADTEGGSGWAYDPYTYMMRKENNDFSDCTAEELAYYLTLSDGAYTENILHELDLRWQDDPEGVDQLMESKGASISPLWASHKAANPDIFGARFSADEIEAAYQAVRDYAAANGFSVENLRYDTVTDWSQSQVILRNGVLQDNMQQDGLTIDDVITVVGDAQFGENAWRESADGWSFTLYRGADGRWVLEDSAFGY